LISYYWSLPAVVAVVFLLAAKLVAMQRAEIIDKLSDRVAHRDPNDATAAVRQLGDMPHPPVSVLVAAAAVADRKVAYEAQQTITRLLRRAQQKIEAGRSAKSVSRQLTELARELADHRHVFPVADQAWLVSTTQRILHLANKMPRKHTPVVAANCDLILTSIPTATDNVAGADGPRDAAEQNSVTAAATADKNIKNANDPADKVATPDAESTEAIIAPRRGDSSRPVIRMLPASPKNNRPQDPTTPPTSSSHSAPPELPADVELIGKPLADAEVRALLEKWKNKGDGLTSLEKEQLKRRGFDRLPVNILQKLFSHPQDRLQLVDDVMREPGLNARPWLLLLADDPDADVRLAALTVMATSTDAALVEFAWQKVIHDRDPRVAALASRLRERRAASQRR
jgi:hypothetical protein